MLNVLPCVGSFTDQRYVLTGRLVILVGTMAISVDVSNIRLVLVLYSFTKIGVVEMHSRIRRGFIVPGWVSCQ